VILKCVDDDPDTEDDGDQRRKTLADVFLSVARIAIYVVAGLLALEQVGFNTGPILGSVAILGLAISFGSQNLVRDVVNGFFILLENQYAVGDVVTLNGQTGTVEKISIRSTWIRQWTGQLHAIPNGSISLVSNHTRDWAVAVCDVGVAYDSDLARVKTVVERIADELFVDEEWAEAFEEKPTWGGVVTLGDSAITVRLQGKVEAGKQWGVGREMNRRVHLVFGEEGIEIPFPQQVVHHVNPPA
jgi:small conductance mechanosensitive channel